MAQPASPIPAPRATAAMGDTATCTPSPAPPPAPAPQPSLTSTACWLGGIFGHCPVQVGACAWQGGEPQPCSPRPWDARATPVVSAWQISPGEVSGCGSGRCETPLLGKSTALYVTRGDRVGEGDARAPRVEWQLGVPVSLCTPLRQDPWGPSGSTGLEGGGASCVTAALVLSCPSLTPSRSPTAGLSHPGLPGGKGFPEQHQHHPDVSQLWSGPLPTSGNQQGWAWGHRVWDTKRISPHPRVCFSSPDADKPLETQATWHLPSPASSLLYHSPNGETEAQ